MDFGFTSEQEMLRRSFADFLKKECSPDLVRQFWNDEKGYSEAIWKKMARLGWLGLIYDGKYGGSSGSFLDLFILFEEIGKVLLPSPFFTSAVLAGLIIAEAGDERLKKAYLPAIISGKKILTLALMDEQCQYDHHSPRIRAAMAEGGKYLLDGTRLLVPYANAADEILLCANLKNGCTGPTIFRIKSKSPGLIYTPLKTIYGENKFGIQFNGVEAADETIIGAKGQGAAYIETVLPRAVLLKCAEMLGGMKHVVDSTVAYARQRHQFGRPLGVFQAVQHHCVDMTTYYEGSRLSAYQAASLFSENIPCAKETAMAKAWCSESYKKCTWIAQQIHGGIGFTEEYHLQLYFKHAKEAELSFGDARYHRNIVAAEMGL
jgi:alkylation response protein AidB-like acyl-CoA dehydrogenase